MHITQDEYHVPFVCHSMKQHTKRKRRKIEKNKRRIIKRHKLHRQSKLIQKRLCDRAKTFCHDATLWVKKSHTFNEFTSYTPQSIRILTLIGGFIVFITSFIQLLDLLLLKQSPILYILYIYELFLGLGTIIIETKDILLFESSQLWITEWFQFLTLFFGKGCFYLFIGILDISLSQHHFYLCISGVYMCMLSFFYFSLHFGLRSKLQDIGFYLTQHYSREESSNNSLLPDNEFIQNLTQFQKQRVLLSPYDTTSNYIMSTNHSLHPYEPCVNSNACIVSHPDYEIV